MVLSARHRLRLAIAALILIGGCATRAPTPADASAAVRAIDGRALPLFRGQTGAPMAWPDLIALASAADVVLVGETHYVPEGQVFQAALFEDLLRAAPTAAAALEFAPRDRQGLLDDYLSGVITREQFRRLTDAAESDRSPGHWAIIERSRESNRPVIAANAPRRYTSLARTGGFGRLSALSAEQRRLFRIPDSLPSDRYRDAFFEFMTGHNRSSPTPTPPPNAEAIERAESMFRAQSLWDWTMADSVSRGLDEGARPVMLIVGRFHTEHDGGVVQALRAIRPGARVLTITLSPESAAPPSVEDLSAADVIVPMPNR